MARERHAFDKSSKWLIQTHGNSILYLGGLRECKTWRALQAELVQPRTLPDGLLEVLFHGRSRPDYFLLEIATFPETRISKQALDDLGLAYHQLHVLPELLTAVLAPRGRVRVSGSHEVESRLKWSRLACAWKVVELWQLRAEDLLAAGDVGLLPWVPLTQFAGLPATIFEECRRQIEENAPVRDRENLLAVSQILARLRYNAPELLAILGGRHAMIESPLLKEIVADATQKATQKAILEFLRGRFGEAPNDVEQRLRTIRGEKKLKALVRHASRCPNLEAFRRRLLS